MADDPGAIAPLEQASPAIEPVTLPPVDEPAAIPATEPTNDNEPEAEQPVEDDGLDDLEFGFKQYRVPKDLKSGIEKWRAETTKKEQSVAARAKELDARALQQSQADETELHHRAALADVNSQLEGYKNVDWVALHAQDPYGAGQHQAYYQQLKERKAQSEQAVAEATKTRTEFAQQDFAKRAQETREFAEKSIKGWSPDLDRKLQEFAQGKGVSADFVQQNMSPTFYELVHLAFVGEQTLKQAAAAPRPASAVQPVAPLQKVGGKSAPVSSGDLANLPMEAYVAARKRGIGGKALG